MNEPKVDHIAQMRPRNDALRQILKMIEQARQAVEQR